MSNRILQSWNNWVHDTVFCYCSAIFFFIICPFFFCFSLSELGSLQQMQSLVSEIACIVYCLTAIFVFLFMAQTVFSWFPHKIKLWALVNMMVKLHAQ
jgi:hypothetical protein